MTPIPAMSTKAGSGFSKGDILTLRARSLEQRLATPDAFLSRTDLRSLGLERRAVDAVFRAIAAGPGIVTLPGYRRPLIRVRDYLALLERSTFTDEAVR